MSRPLHNLENSSEINTKIIGNNSLGETNKIKILKDIISKNSGLYEKKNIKRINSSSLFKLKLNGNAKLKKKNLNSIPKIKSIIELEIHKKEPLTLVKNMTNYHQAQINIIQKLKEKIYTKDELTNDLSILLEDCPIINKFTEKRFLSKEDFDIFLEDKDKKFLFVLNICNVINIINLIWFYSEEDTTIFCEYLDKLGLYFSYVVRDKDKNIIDLVLLTKIPFNLYNYISTYADGEFKNTKLRNLAERFSRFNTKSKYDVGYCYQDLTIMNLLNQMNERQFLLNDEIMYYFNQKGAKKIISYDLVTIPEGKETSCSIKKIKGGKEVFFKGYNEFDLCLTMLEDVVIEKNNNFNYIQPGKDTISGVKLDQGITYLFEIKTDINNIIDKIDKIEAHKNRFVEAYNNICINNKKKYNINNNNSELILICNKNKNAAQLAIINNQEKLFNMSNVKEFIFSGSQIGVGVALQFKRDIKNLKNENINIKIQNANLKEGYDNLRLQNATLKEDFAKLNDENIVLKTKISDFEKTLNSWKETQYKNILIALKFINFIKLSEVIYFERNNLINLVHEKYFGLYQIFNSMSDNFKELKKHLLFHQISPFLGKKIESKEDKEKWCSLKDIIFGKINNKNIVSIYYKGILELLFGLKHLKKNEAIDYDIYSEEDDQFLLLIKQLILFTEIFEDNIEMKDIEMKYQGAVLYIIDSCIDKEFISNVIQEESNYNQKTMKLISICNAENYYFYFPNQ